MSSAIVPKRRGRPPGKEPVPEELARSYCEWLSEGKPAAQWHRIAGHPKTTTVWLWIEKDTLFAERVARAREEGLDRLAHECLTIADDGSNDWMEANAPEDKRKLWKLNGEHVQRSKLRVETRLKLLACWDPKRYGAQMQVAHDHSVVISLATGIPRIEMGAIGDGFDDDDEQERELAPAHRMSKKVRRKLERQRAKERRITVEPCPASSASEPTPE